MLGVVFWSAGPGHAGAQNPGIDDSATVPFTFPRNQVLIPIYIGGEGPFSFIVDTAINPSVIDLALSEDLGLGVDLASPIPAAGIGTGSPVVYPTRIEAVAVGDVFVGDVEAVAMDLGLLSERLGAELHGALGYSFLSSRAVRIDYPRREITVFQGPAPDGIEAGGVVLPLDLRGTTPRISPVLLNGVPLVVDLDTGGSLSLNVSSTAGAHPRFDEFKRAGEAGGVVGARGEAAVIRAIADSVSIGGMSVVDSEIAFATWDHGSDALLGNGFLQHFVLTVDYVRGTIRLARPTPDRR